MVETSLLKFERYSFYCFKNLDPINLITRIFAQELFILSVFIICNFLPIYLSFLFAPKDQWLLASAYQTSLIMYNSLNIYWAHLITKALNLLSENQTIDSEALFSIIQRRSYIIFATFFSFPLTWLPFNFQCNQSNCNLEKMNYIEIQVIWTLINSWNIIFCLVSYFFWTRRQRSAHTSYNLESLMVQCRTRDHEKKCDVKSLYV